MTHGIETEHNGYLLCVERIPEGQPCAGKYRVRARPIHAHGYMFYAYETLDEAESVLFNLLNGSFDDQVYRVNFQPDNARFTKNEAVRKLAETSAKKD